MNTTQPEAPAMPSECYSVCYTGLTAREHAGIHLLQPTGTNWLDEMIHARRRDELAKAALTGILGSGLVDGTIPFSSIAADAYQDADAMLAATRPTGNGEGKQ